MERMSCLLMNSYRGPPTEFILPQKTKKKQKGSTNKKERKETFYAASQIWRETSNQMKVNFISINNFNCLFFSSSKILDRRLDRVNRQF